MTARANFPLRLDGQSPSAKDTHRGSKRQKVHRDPVSQPYAREVGAAR
jgi:hypothetical protein